MNGVSAFVFTHYLALKDLAMDNYTFPQLKVTVIRESSIAQPFPQDAVHRAGWN